MNNTKQNSTRLKPLKRWNQQLAGMSVIMLAVLVSTNYFVDPYLIFHSNTFLPSSTSNERFNKIEYLLNHKRKHNAFLLGSSRMGVYKPSWFNYTDVRYYNLSVFSGDAKDSLKMLELLKRKGVSIKEIVLGIDLFPFIEKQRSRSTSLQHHPMIRKSNYANYYISHLFSSSFYQCYLKLEQHFGQRSFTFNYTTGQWSLKAMDELRQIDPDRYQQRFFKESTQAPMKVIFQKERFDELKQLITWLNINNIHARYFIHPFSHIHQKRFSVGTFNRLQQQIQLLIPNVQDFSTRTDWTHDTDNYYEEKHYRSRLAKKLAVSLQK